VIYTSVPTVAIAQVGTALNPFPALLALSQMSTHKVQFKLLEDSSVLQLMIAISAQSTFIARKELITDFNTLVKTVTCVL
jgi:hypothetical protein